MATIKTKWFASAMAGAPALSGSVGAMIAVLDACLKDGFNLTTLTSLVIASNVATATKAGHAYIVNQVLELAGITGACAALNGNVRITEVTTDTFKFATTGISDQTATGTITAKAAAAGWEKQFSGTNLAVYRSGDLLSSRSCLRVDDTVGQYSAIAAAESYTDISTAINTLGTQYFKKSNATDATARPWLVIADDKTAYIGVQWTNAGVYDFYSFGDFQSFVAGDAYNFRLQGLAQQAPATIGQYSSVSDAAPDTVNYSLISRPYSMIYTPTALWQGSAAAMSACIPGVSFPWALSGHHGWSSNLNSATYVSPAQTDNGYHFLPVYLVEISVSGRSLRGVARGFLHCAEYVPQASGYSIVSGVENADSGLVLMARSAGHVTSAAGSYIYPASSVAFRLGGW